MMPAQPRVISIRHGGVQPGGSWLYVWIDMSDVSIAYVGGTGFDPELRAHLHLTSDDPDIGRVKATVQGYEERDFDVLAFSLPHSVPRPPAKRALIAQLAQLGHIAGEEMASDGQPPSVIDPIAEAVDRYVNELRRKPLYAHGEPPA